MLSGVVAVSQYTASCSTGPPWPTGSAELLTVAALSYSSADCTWTAASIANKINLNNRLINTTVYIPLNMTDKILTEDHIK